jgi:uncharacterized protein (TIGR02996 family)
VSAFPTNPELEAAVVANADEDTPRLAYADWLDENGDSRRAAFIRAQIRLASGSSDDPDWADLLEQEAELIRLIGPPLPAPLHFSTIYTVPYRAEIEQQVYRGFPFLVYVSGRGVDQAAQLLNDLATVFATTTIRGVSFSGVPVALINQFLDLPNVGQLRGLSLHQPIGWVDRNVTLSVWKKFIDSPAGQHLEIFAVHETLSTEILNTIISSESCGGVRRFHVPHFQAKPDDIRKLFAANWAKRLRYVDAMLSHEPTIDEAVISGLAELPELHTLKVANQAAVQLARLKTARFPKLGALALFGPTVMSGGGVFTIKHFRELLGASWFDQVRVLDLRGFGEQAVTALAKHPVAKKLRGLCLDRSRLGKQGLRALARPGAFPELVSLDLRDGFLARKTENEAEMMNFISTLTLPKLKWLNLSRWPLYDEGAKVLANNSGLPSLAHLNVDSCILYEPGKKALEDSPHFRAIVKCKPLQPPAPK